MGAGDYGMRVWDADGNLKLDVTDRVTRLRYQNTVAEESSGNSGALADISGHDSVQFCISTNSLMPHVVTRSGTTISWVSRSLTSYDDYEIMVFLY